MQDIRKTARDVVTKKWQVRWDSSNSGRHYYRFHKVVKDKVKKDLPNKRLYTVINRDKISQQLENCENRNDPDLVQAFLKKWWVESDFKAPNLPLSLRNIFRLCRNNYKRCIFI
jgi:hypothetical protein